jgi:hypothetical protein
MAIQKSRDPYKSASCRPARPLGAFFKWNQYLKNPFRCQVGEEFAEHLDFSAALGIGLIGDSIRYVLPEALGLPEDHVNRCAIDAGIC